MVAGGYKQWEQKVSSPDLPTRMIQSMIQDRRARERELHYFPMGSVQYDPMLSGVKRVGVNHVITSPLSLGKLPKQ